MSEILVVEDNKDLREIVVEALAGEGHAMSACGSAEEAFELLAENTYDLVVTDLKLPEKDGIEVLSETKSKSPDTDVIVVTAYGTVDKAVEAMKKGAVDFITKPFSIDHVRLQAARILQNKKVKEENRYLKNASRREIIGISVKFNKIMDFASKVAESDATVLITGESGSGKELIAEEIHFKSKRRNGPLVKVNCAALAPGVLESELFGHEKGAFTDAAYAKKGRFEIADKGTIFLDEIGDLPLNLQVKLLRALQEKEFERVGGEKTIRTDVRVIAATNRDLKQEIKEGRFREELFYRLNVVQMEIPPLRDRKDDIPALVGHFIKKYSDYNGFKVKSISKEAMDVLYGYSYPGNIRELENIMQRILVICSEEVIKAGDIPYEISSGSASENKGTLTAKVENYEKELIVKALNETKGNKMKAAELLNVNRATLMSKIKKYGL